MLIAYKYRLYPNKGQQEYFAKCFGCVRFIYNRMLSDNHHHPTRIAISLLFDSIPVFQLKRYYQNPISGYTCDIPTNSTQIIPTFLRYYSAYFKTPTNQPYSPTVVLE